MRFTTQQLHSPQVEQTQGEYFSLHSKQIFNQIYLKNQYILCLQSPPCTTLEHTLQNKFDLLQHQLKVQIQYVDVFRNNPTNIIMIINLVFIYDSLDYLIKI
ncbi:hypothetical protein pb186bvf_013962 [Paramecium bursaria]